MQGRITKNKYHSLNPKDNSNDSNGQKLGLRNVTYLDRHKFENHSQITNSANNGKGYPKIKVFAVFRRHS